MLLQLAYFGVANVFALLRLLPMSSRDKDAEILALRHQLLDRVLHLPRRPMVLKTSRKPLDDSRLLFHLPQQQPARVRGDRTAVKPPHHLPWIQGVKFKGLLVTLCRHKAVASPRHKGFLSKILMPEVTAFFNSPVRNAG